MDTKARCERVALGKWGSELPPVLISGNVLATYFNSMYH